MTFIAWTDHYALKRVSKFVDAMIEIVKLKIRLLEYVSSISW